MPVDFTIDNKRQLIIGRGYGSVNHIDLLNVVKMMVIHPDYNPDYNEIWDIRDVDELSTLFEQTEERVRKEHASRKLNKPNKEAIVVSKPVQYGSARQYAVLAKKIPLDVEVFYDYNEALAWVIDS